MSREPSRYLSTAEAAEYLGVSPQLLAKWRSLGEGPSFVRITRQCIRYDREQLEAWASARTVTPAAA